MPLVSTHTYSNIGDPPPFTRTPKKKTTLNIGIFGLCKLCQSPMSQVQFRKSFPMKEGRRYLIGYPVDLDPLSIFWVMVDGHGGFCYNWTCYDLGLLNPISNLPSNLAWIMMWHINVNLTPKHWVYLYNRDILGGKSSTAPKKVPRFCSGIMERDETYAVRTWCNGLLLFYPQPCHLKINIVSFSILVKKHIGSINSTKLVKLFFLVVI